MAFFLSNYITSESDPFVPQVCVTSDVSGNIELELIVTLDINDGKASKYIMSIPILVCDQLLYSIPFQLQLLVKTT